MDASQKFSAILFDMNGIIVDDEDLHEGATRKVLKEVGHELNHTEYQEFFAGRTDKEAFVTFSEAKNSKLNIPQLLKNKSAYYQISAADKLESYPGVVEVIKMLRKKSFRLSLVTSSVRSETETILKSFGISEEFEVVLTAEDITKGKPNPEGYLKAASLLKIEPNQCIVIEDAPAGVLAAHTAGMACLAITNTHSRDELNDADFILSDLSEKTITSLGF